MSSRWLSYIADTAPGLILYVRGDRRYQRRLALKKVPEIILLKIIKLGTYVLIILTGRSWLPPSRLYDTSSIPLDQRVVAIEPEIFPQHLF